MGCEENVEERKKKGTSLNSASKGSPGTNCSSIKKAVMLFYREGERKD